MGTADCGNGLSCGALDWSAGLNGADAVCGRSELRSVIGSSETCIREATYVEAQQLCGEVGARLCTIEELQQGEGDPHSCGYDTLTSWSWAANSSAVCSGSDPAAAAVPGEWFRLTAPVEMGYVEMQIQHTGAADATAPRLDVAMYDEMGTPLPALVLQVDRGVMIGINVSSACTNLFVHINSNSGADDGAEYAAPQYTVVALVPQVYTPTLVPVDGGGANSPPPPPVNPFKPDDGGAGGSSEPVELPISAISAAPVQIDLPFPFAFYGRTYTSAWVSPRGFLSFDEPTDSGMHPSIVAALGDYDWSREGSRITSLATPSDLKINWRAPIYRNPDFTDVSVTLSTTGDVLVTWNEIDVSEQASINRDRLVAWLPLDTPAVQVADGTTVMSDASGNDHFGTVTMGEGSAVSLLDPETSFSAVSHFGSPELTVGAVSSDPCVFFRGGANIDGISQSEAYPHHPHLVQFTEGHVHLCEANNEELNLPESQPGHACGIDGDDPRVLAGTADMHMIGVGSAFSAAACAEKVRRLLPDAYGATWWQSGFSLEEWPPVSLAPDEVHASDSCFGLTFEPDEVNGCVRIGCVDTSQGSPGRGGYGRYMSRRYQDRATCLFSRTTADHAASAVQTNTTDTTDTRCPLYEMLSGPATGAAASTLAYSKEVGRRTRCIWSIQCEVGSPVLEVMEFSYAPRSNIKLELVDPDSPGLGVVRSFYQESVSPTENNVYRASGSNMHVRLDASAVTDEEGGGDSGFRVRYSCEGPVSLSAPPRVGMQVVNDAYLTLPPMELGGSIGVSSWVQIGRLSGGVNGASGMLESSNNAQHSYTDAGLTDFTNRGAFSLFSSYQSTECEDSDACRNAVHEEFDAHGWISIGNPPHWTNDEMVSNEMHNELWMPGQSSDFSGVANAFWERAARFEWVHVAFTSVQGSLGVDAYINGELVLTVALESPIPRMMRQANFVGSHPHAPFVSKGYSTAIALSDFRLHDRTISSAEIAAMWRGAVDGCCVAAGMTDSFGAGSFDFSQEILTAPAAVAVASHSAQTTEHGLCEPATDHSVAQTTPVQVYMFEGGEHRIDVDACSGTIDAMGYENSAVRTIVLNGKPGVTYAFEFQAFDTEADFDFFSITDAEGNPVLHHSGTSVPEPVSVNGPNVQVDFVSDQTVAASGVQATFTCSHPEFWFPSPWRPATVAQALQFDAPPLQASQAPKCINVATLLSVQCCADAQQSCAKSRVVGMELAKAGLRGTLPAPIGNLKALQSLVLHDNYLTGVRRVPVALHACPSYPYPSSRMHLIVRVSRACIGRRCRQASASYICSVNCSSATTSFRCRRLAS